MRSAANCTSSPTIHPLPFHKGLRERQGSASPAAERGSRSFLEPGSHTPDLCGRGETVSLAATQSKLNLCGLRQQIPTASELLAQWKAGAGLARLPHPRRPWLWEAAAGPSKLCWQRRGISRESPRWVATACLG